MLEFEPNVTLWPPEVNETALILNNLRRQYLHKDRGVVTINHEYEITASQAAYQFP